MFLPVQVPSFWTFTFSSSSPPHPHGSLQPTTVSSKTHVWSVSASALQALLQGEGRVGAAGGDDTVPGDLTMAAPGGTRFFKHIKHAEL